MSGYYPDATTQADIDRALDGDPEDLCEMSQEPGDPCPNLATDIIEEPYTPGHFKLHVCEAHRREQVAFGYYYRGKI